MESFLETSATANFDTWEDHHEGHSAQTDRLCFLAILGAFQEKQF